MHSQKRRPDPTRSKPARKLFPGIVIAVGVITLVVLALIPALVTGSFVNQHVKFRQTYTAEAYGLSSNRLTLTTEDGIRLVAYEVYVAEPHAVVIFLSGIHNPSVTAFFGHAKMLQDHGYASILLEMRAHGESEGSVIALGFEEHLDTRAAVDYIKGNDDYDETPIVVYGMSMGGAVAINSIGLIPEIDGLISMSAYSAWADVFVENMGLPEPFASVQRPFVRLYTTLKYGVDTLHIYPKGQIRNLGDRPALIIHARGDSQVPYSNFVRIMEQAPAHVESWVREGDLHFIVKNDLFLTPEEDAEYVTQVIGFLDRHFGP
jgi:uncharacterized protein